MFRYVVPEFDLGYRVNFNPLSTNTIPKKRTRRDVCIAMKFPATKIPGKIHKHVVFLLATAKDDEVFQRIKDCEKKGYTAYLVRLYTNKKSKSPGFAPMFLPSKTDRPTYTKYIGFKNCLDQIIRNPVEEKYIIYFDSTRFVYDLKDKNAYEFNLMQPLTIHPTRLTDCLLDYPSKLLNESDILLTFNTSHPSLSIKAIIKELPAEDNYILFSALGPYDVSMKNEVILRTFLEFVRKYGEYLNTTMVLVFGGTYNTEDDFVNYNNLKNTYYNCAEYPNTIVHFAKDLLPMEVRAVLKRSSLMLDFSSTWDERKTCQYALKYSTPLIVGPLTSSRHLVENGNNGFVVDMTDIDFNSTLMRFSLDDHERLCDNARKFYSKNFSKWARTLAEINDEDNPIEIHNDID